MSKSKDVKITRSATKKLLDELGINYVFVDDDKCPTHDQGAEPKLQEVTNDDLGASICSIDEMSFGWQCKMLFTNEQARRVLNGLLDAKLNVTEAHVVYEGNKVTMLTVAKAFPSGTKNADIEKFDRQLHRFTYCVCEAANIEARLEAAKEKAIEAFNTLQNYE